MQHAVDRQHRRSTVPKTHLSPPQVISRYSGYGRTGGFRSRKWHQMYTLHNHQPGNRDCSGTALCTRQPPHRGPAGCRWAFAAYFLPAPGRRVCDLT